MNLFRSRNNLKIGLGIMVIFLSVLLPLHADPMKLTLSTDVEGRYTDNVFFDFNDYVSDYSTRISPGIKGGWDKEDWALMFSGTAHFFRYLEYDELDAVDQLYSGRLDRQWGLRFSTFLSANFLIDERRDRELSETGLLFDDGRRWRQTYGLGGQYQMGELTIMSLSYNLQVEDFDNETNYDAGIHSVQLLVSRNLDSIWENSTGRFQTAGKFYEYRRDYHVTEDLLGDPVGMEVEDRQNIDYYSMSLGIGYQWTEKLSLTVDLGARFSRNEQQATHTFEPNNVGLTAITDEEESTSTGYVVLLEMNYKGEKGLFNVLASHDLAPASGRDGTTERSTLRLGLERRLARQWFFDCSLRTYLNRSDESGVTSDDDELTVEVKTGLRYAFHPRWNLGAYWRTYWLDDRQLHVDRNQNTMTLLLDWNWPILE